MEVQKVEIVRYTASEGMSLQWKQKFWSFTEHKEVVVPMFAEKVSLIDTSTLVGEVEEVPFEHYQKWYEKHACVIPTCCGW